MTDMTEWIRKADIKDIDRNLQVRESTYGIRYSIMQKSEEYAYDRFVVFKGVDAPVVYPSGSPQEVLNLRSALNDYLDYEGVLEYDIIIHCRKELFNLLMKVNS